MIKPSDDAAPDLLNFQLPIPRSGKPWSNAAMSRTAARFSQADLNRAIRAAKQAGAAVVLLLPDGTIRIDLQLAISSTPTHWDLIVRPDDSEEAVL